MSDYKEVERPRHYQKTIASFVDENDTLEYFTTVPYLTFLLSGVIRVSIDDETTVVFDRPTLFLVPKEKLYKRTVLERAHILPFPLGVDVMSFSLLSLPQDQYSAKQPGLQLTSLSLEASFCKLLTLFADSFYFPYLNAAYYELKLGEIIYLIQRFFTEEQRVRFFSSLIDSDFVFSDFVINNYKQVTFVRELAELSGYSLQGFEKRFKKVFCKIPSEWLRDQKKTNISKDLFYTNKTLKQIGFEYGFYSPAHFNNYCKSVFGKSPGEMRKTEFIAHPNETT